MYGEQLRAVVDHVVIAEYHWRYDWRTHKVTEIPDGVFYPTRFASPQGSLIPLTPQEALVLYRPQPVRRPARLAFSTQQLMMNLDAAREVYTAARRERLIASAEP